MISPSVILHRELPFCDPEAVFVHLFGAADDAFWLDGNDSRWSFMGAAHLPGCFPVSKSLPASPGILDQLATGLATRRQSFLPLDCPFQAGFVGYLGYEIKAECGAASAHRSPLPDAQWIFAASLIACDAERRVTHLFSCPADNGDPSACLQWLDSTADALRHLPSPPAPPPLAPVAFRPRLSREAYLARIDACLAAIQHGESYEICLTNQFTAPPIAQPLAFYRALRRRNPAPYSSYLRFGKTAIACSSPEQFLRITPDGLVTSRPIKGTAPRHPDLARDLALRNALADDAKSRAENMMIVDLVRNDLGRISEPCSVRVPRLMEIESYAAVHQMVTTVEGRLRPGISAVDCVRAAFPGGSMTGATENAHHAVTRQTGRRSSRNLLRGSRLFRSERGRRTEYRHPYRRSHCAFDHNRNGGRHHSPFRSPLGMGRDPAQSPTSLLPGYYSVNKPDRLPGAGIQRELPEEPVDRRVGSVTRSRTSFK